MATTKLKKFGTKAAAPATSALPKPTFGQKKAAPETTKPKFGTKAAKPAPEPEPEPEETPTPTKKFGAKAAAKPAPKKTEPAAEPDDEPEPATSTALIVKGDQVQGEIDRSDFIMPRLKMVHAIGPMSEQFEPGCFVINGEIPISDGQEDGSGSELEVTIMRIRKRYEENIPWGDDTIPRVFDTVDQVKEAGGHIEWIDNTKPPFSPKAECLIMVKCPADQVVDMFPFEVEGENYAMLMWELKGSAYTRAAKPIYTAAEFSLKAQGLPYGRWKLTTKRVTLNGNPTWVPVLVRNGVNEEDQVSAFEQILGT